MKLELFHKWLCPYSARVRDFIEDHHLKQHFSMIELDEIDGSREKLKSISGKTQVPCLVIDGRPLLESPDIIRWIRENLQSQGDGASAP